MADKIQKYLKTTRKKFDPVGLFISLAGILGVLITIAGPGASGHRFWDFDSFIVVVVGTLATLLFQFDLSTTLRSFYYVLKSLVAGTDARLLRMIKELDTAIVTQGSLASLRPGDEISGELLNDIVFMHRQGLLADEIETLVTARIEQEYLGRQVAVSLLQKGSIAGPALGLFGTVIGLIGVLRSLSNPADIGPSMSLALLTTVYGSAMSSLIMNPLAGRLEHQNVIFLEVHRQLLNKVNLLLIREERNTSEDFAPEALKRA